MIYVSIYCRLIYMFPTRVYSLLSPQLNTQHYLGSRFPRHCYPPTYCLLLAYGSTLLVCTASALHSLCPCNNPIPTCLTTCTVV